MTTYGYDQAFDYSRFFDTTPEQQQAILDKSKKVGFGQAFGAATESEWVTSWIGRQLTAGIAGLDPDPGYNPLQPDEFDTLTEGLDPAYWGELGGANSRRQALKIRDNMLEVQKARDTIARAGGSGVAATIGAAFLDPAVVAASFGVGSIIGVAGRSASVGTRFLRGGAAGLMVDVPTETYLASQDPERGVADVLLTGAASFTLGGFGDLVGGRLVNRAQRADEATIRAAMGTAAGDELRPLGAGESAARAGDPDPISTSLRTHLANEGASPEEIEELAADPEAWSNAKQRYTASTPPDIPADPDTLIGSVDYSEAGDAPVAFSRIRRSFAGWLGDARLPANARRITNRLVTDPLAKADGSVSVMAADELSARVYAASRDELERVAVPAFRKWQKASGKRAWTRGTDGLDDFARMVAREVELGVEKSIAPPGDAGDAIRDAAKGVRDFHSRWVDRLEEGGAIDPETASIYRENPGYLSRSLDSRKIRHIEQRFGDAGRRAMVEVVARSHARAVGYADDAYLEGKDIVDALGWNFRGILKKMDPDERAAWVSEKLANRLDTERVATISAYADDPQSLYDEFVAPYYTSHRLARVYIATARGLGDMSGADRLQMFVGKQLETLRRVLSEEAALTDMTAEQVDEIVRRVAKRAPDSETGKPSNLRFRTPLDHYERVDVTEILEEAGYDMGGQRAVWSMEEDFLNRNVFSLTDNYARAMSGHLAVKKVLQSLGDDAENPSTLLTHQALRDRYVRELKASGDYDTRLGQGAIHRFDAAMREILHIQQPAGFAGENLRQPIRVWRRFLNSVLNGSFGFAAVPESARILAYGGTRNTIDSIPMLQQMLRLAREGKIRNEDLDLGDFLANVMTSGEHNPLLSAMDPEEYLSFGGRGLMDRAERGAAYLERASFHLSGFVHMERNLRRIAAAAGVNKYVNDFARGRPWNARKLAAAGLTPEQAERVGKAIKHELARENGAVKQVKSSWGHKTTRFNIDQFEDQVAASYLTRSMSKWMSRVFQESTLGSRYLLQTDPTLRLMTHFLDFALQGYEKHTLYGLQHLNDPRVWEAFVLTSFLGALTYIAQTYTMKGELPEGTDELDIFMAGMQRGGQLSILPQVADMFGSITGAGTPFDARSSGLTYGGEVPGLESNPSTAYLDTFRRAVHGVGTAIGGDDFSRQDANALWKMLPGHRIPYLHSFGRAIANQLPEERR